MKPIKIAMLGLTHGHTRKYYQVLRQNPLLEWVGAASSDPDAQANFLRVNPDIPLYDNADALLAARPNVQAMVIASANCEHLADFEFCARHGIDVLMMKIPTFDMAEYDRMLALEKETGIVCQVELEMHFNPVVNRIKDLVASGDLGTLRSIEATNVTLCPAYAFPWQGSPEQSYGRRVPLGDGRNPRFRGGALCDHPHIFDLARVLTGSEFDTIYAQCAPNIRTDLEVEDMLSVNARMKNGVIVSLDPSWSKRENPLPVPGPGWEVEPKRMEVNVTLCGDRGSVFADCFGPNVFHDGGPNDRYTVQYTYFDEWVGLMDEFAECVRTRRAPLTNLQSHRKTIEAMLACYESIASGKPVKL